MNCILRAFLFSLFISQSLFGGKITVHNQTGSAATARFKTTWPDSSGISWTQGENETAFAVPAYGKAEWNGPGVALNKFKFNGSGSFAIGGMWGERYTAGSDGIYADIVVPVSGSWDIYIVNK